MELYVSNKSLEVRLCSFDLIRVVVGCRIPLNHTYPLPLAMSKRRVLIHLAMLKIHIYIENLVTVVDRASFITVHLSL